MVNEYTEKFMGGGKALRPLSMHLKIPLTLLSTLAGSPIENSLSVSEETMLKVASYAGTSRTPCSDLNVFNSKNPYTGFLGILDSGATSGFAPTGWLQHMTRVVNLKTPVQVKLGTSMSLARFVLSQFV